MSRLTTLGLAVATGLLGLTPAGLAAQGTDTNPDNTPYGTTAAEFLLFGAGARGSALGDAFAAIATDISSLYYNPAGASLISGPGASVSTYDYVAETRYSWGGIAFPFSGGSRTFGLQIGTFGFDNQPVFTVDQPDGTGAVYSVSQTFAGASFAQNFSDRFSAGLTAKFVVDQLGEVNGSAFAVDFGTNFHATLNDHPIKLAFVVSNLGTDLTLQRRRAGRDGAARARRTRRPRSRRSCRRPASSRPRASPCRRSSASPSRMTSSRARATG